TIDALPDGLETRADVVGAIHRGATPNLASAATTGVIGRPITLSSGPTIPPMKRRPSPCAAYAPALSIGSPDAAYASASRREISRMRTTERHAPDSGPPPLLPPVRAR